MEQSTGEIITREFLGNEQLSHLYSRLEAGLRASAHHEAISMREFEQHAENVILTKKEAQRQIFQELKKLKKSNMVRLMMPDNLLEFEHEFDRFHTITKSLEHDARTYSLAVKIFINVFLHEVQAIRSVKTERIIATIEKQKKDILEAEEALEGSFNELYRDLNEVSRLCHNEVERFVHTGAVIEFSGTHAVLIQSLAEFVLAYNEILKKEKKAFKYIAKFVHKYESKMRQVNEDVAVSRKMLAKNKIAMKDVWVYYEPHVKLFHLFTFIAIIGAFFAVSSVLGIVGVVAIKGVMKMMARFSRGSIKKATGSFGDIEDVADIVRWSRQKR